jgi:hypothetical protein
VVERTATVIALALYGLVALCLTLLFFGMRAVMEIGGSCGGAFAPCPSGTAATIPLAIIVGMFAAFGSVLFSLRAGLPVLTGFAWPALFLSLGWNFLEYGISPPHGNVGRWGMLICGAIFVLLGGIPLIGLSVASARPTVRGLPAGLARRVDERIGADPGLVRAVARGGSIAIVSAAALGALAGYWLQRALL